MLDGLKQRAARRMRRVANDLTWLSNRIGPPIPPPTRDELRVLAGNAVLRDCCAGRPGFVIGNGPSLVKQDLRPLTGQVTFVANGFWRHPAVALPEGGGKPAWQPTFYAIIDPLYFDGCDAIRAFYGELRARIDGARFLIPAGGVDVVRDQDLLPADRLHPCIFRGDLATQQECAFDFTRPLPGLFNVSLLTILAAMYTGCNPIYLLGMDHDWLARPNCHSTHFYQVVTVDNHEEVRAIEREGRYSYRFNIECALAAFRSYEAILKTAREHGIQILNATDGGFLDVFPRVEYEDVAASLKSQAAVVSEPADSGLTLATRPA